MRGQEIEPPTKEKRSVSPFPIISLVVSGGMSSSYPLRASVIGSRDAGHRSGFRKDSSTMGARGDMRVFAVKGP